MKRRQAAQVLDTSISTLKALEKSGKLKPRRIGARHVFYAVDEVEALARDV
jgi:predicted site-specific integrase-resolvase